MDRVRQELSKIMDEPGRRESAKKVQDAIDRTTMYIQRVVHKMKIKNEVKKLNQF